MLKYTAKLTHYAFDNTYTNARLFETKTERDTYFDNLAGYTQDELVNFNARDILSTEIIVKVEPNAPLFDLLNYNYCVITQTENDAVVAKLYFFVKRSVQESGGQIRVYLENDILQNYWYDVDFSECMINRAHLDRFEQGDTNFEVKFKGGADSDLFEREDIKDVAKRLINRGKLKPIIDESNEGNNDLNTWIKENVIAWAYVMVSARSTTTGTGEGDILSYTDIDGTFAAVPTTIGQETPEYADAQITYPYMTFCFPITKKNKILRVRNLLSDKYVKIDFNGLNGFLDRNRGYAFVHTIKLSAKPPFFPQDFTSGVGTNYIVEGDVLTINGNGQIGLGVNWRTFIDLAQNDFHGLFIYERDYIKPVTFELDISQILPRTTFDKEEIVGANKNIMFNPKINNMDYKSLNIIFCGNTLAFDIQKLNVEKPKFLYYETIGADITKAVINYKAPNNDGVFNESYAKSFNGLIINNDLSLPIANSQYDTYLANNKNAYLSFSNTQKLTAAQGLIGALGGLLGLSSATASSVAGAGGNIAAASASLGNGLINTALKLNYDRAQFSLSMDNMKNAPDTLSNANGNAILSTIITDIAPYFEIYSALENELKIANDIAYDNGYTYNRYGQVKDFVNTRKYFNYIQASVENIIGNISNEVKLLLRQILANGIKLWHTDNIQFEKENYEKWLEN